MLSNIGNICVKFSQFSIQNVQLIANLSVSLYDAKRVIIIS